MKKLFAGKNWRIWLRIFTYYIIIIDLILGYVVLSSFTFSFYSNSNLHILLESVTAVLAFVIAIFLFARFYSFKNDRLLFLSVGFLGATLLDFYHALSGSGYFVHLFSSAPDRLMDFGWLFSRIFLSFFCVLSLTMERRAQLSEKHSNEYIVYIIASCAIFAIFLLLIFFPLPEIYFSSFFIHRPLEIFSGLFFLFAAYGYIKKGTWREAPFEHWMVVSLIVSGFGDILFIASSQYTYDLMFNLGHLTKLLGYLFVFIGVVIEIFTVCRLKVSDTLLRKNQDKALKKANIGMIEALKESQSKTYELVEKVKELEKTKLASLNILEDLHDEKLKIARSKAKDEALLKSIGEGIIAVDNRGLILVMNSSAEDMLGYTSEENIGNKWTKFISVNNESGKPLVQNKQPLEVALQQGIQSKSSDYFCGRKNKTQFPVSITASPVILDKGIVGAIMVFRDISHEKEIDRTKSEFVSLASHQLQTPLSIIGWFIEMLLSGDAGDMTKEQKEYLKEILQGKTRMVELVNSLLSVSRLEMGTFSIESKKIHIQKILQNVIDDFKSQTVRKKICLKKFLSEKIPFLFMDPNLLNIIFQNIISNAIKYTPEKGTISISLKLKEDMEGNNAAVKKRKYVLFQVADTGYGIPKNQREKIFTKLFRADNIKSLDTEGTGLGLYIVKSILDHSGGDIWFESEANQGTTFYIRLPLEGMRSKEGSHQLH